MTEFSRTPVRRLEEFACALDVAQFPARDGEEPRRKCPGVFAGALPRLLVALRVAGFERLLAMISRFKEFAEIDANQREATVSEARLHDAPRLVRFPQERRGPVPRRRQFA